jgi:hypothetical protein
MTPELIHLNTPEPISEADYEDMVDDIAQRVVELLLANTNIKPTTTTTTTE